jgi:hypothetical protein
LLPWARRRVLVGRRHNTNLMKYYAHIMETALRPTDQQYTWIGGYLGYKASTR